MQVKYVTESGYFNSINHCFHFQKNNKDFLHPIQFQLTYKLKEVAPPTMSPGDILPDMNSYPVLNDAAAKIKRSVSPLVHLLQYLKSLGAKRVMSQNKQIRFSLVCASNVLALCYVKIFFPQNELWSCLRPGFKINYFLINYFFYYIFN